MRLLAASNSKRDAGARSILHAGSTWCVLCLHIVEQANDDERAESFDHSIIQSYVATEGVQFASAHHAADGPAQGVVQTVI